MFTFTIKNGEIINIDSVPDYVIEQSDYKKLVSMKSFFEEKFPNCIFGCVDSTDAEYRFLEETPVPINTVNSSEVMYYGIVKG